MRFYGLDLEDVPLGEMHDMILSLPRGARTLALMYPETTWTNAEYMLADIRDSLLAVTSALAGIECPEPLLRPGQNPKQSTKRISALEAIESREWKEVGHVFR